jgi:DNA-dependent RNA polymerase auxiliary subunit epsilon
MKDSLFRDALPHNYTLLPEGAKGPYFSAISPPLRQKIEKKNGEFEVEFVKQLTGKILSDYSKKCDSLFRSKEFIEKEKDIKSAVYSKGLKSLAEFVFSTSPLTQLPRRSTEKPKATSSSQSGYCSTTCSRQPRIRRAPWCTI